MRSHGGILASQSPGMYVWDSAHKAPGGEYKTAQLLQAQGLTAAPADQPLPAADCSSVSYG